MDPKKPVSKRNKKYWENSLADWKRSLSPQLQSFVDETEEIFGEDGFTITSAQRNKGQLKGDKDKGYSHHWAPGGSDAVDFRPNIRVYNYLQNTKEGLLLMKKYGIGLLDETSEKSMKINKSTGAHFHIGKDSRYTKLRDERLSKIESGEMKPLKENAVIAGYFPKKKMAHDKKPEGMFQKRKYVPDLSMVEGSDDYQKNTYGKNDQFVPGKGFVSSQSPNERDEFGGNPNAPLVGMLPDNDDGKKKRTEKIKFETAYKMAEEAGAKFPSIVAAQFGLETAWGTKQAGGTNNLFNLKWNEAAVKKMRAEGLTITKSPTAVLDKATGSRDYYMQFESEDDAFKGYLAFIKVNPRYAKALKAKTPEEYIAEIKKAGYAEDPKYVSKILNISKQGDNIIPTTKQGLANKKAVAKARKDALNNYKEEVADIENKNKLSDANKEKALYDLNKEYYKKGYITVDENGNATGIISDDIKEQNKKNEKLRIERLNKFKNGESETGALYNAIQNGEFDIQENGGFSLRITEEEYKKLKEKLPAETLKQFKVQTEFSTKSKHSGSGKITRHYQINNDDANGAFEFLKDIEEDYNSATGNTLFFNLEKDPDNGQHIIDGESQPATKLNIKNAKADYSVNKETLKETQKKNISINPTWDQEIADEEAALIEDKEPDIKNESTTKVDYSNSDLWYNTDYEAKQPKTYDAESQKDNFPYADVVTAMGGIAMGLHEAGKKTPRRDEKLNDALVAYTHDLKRISQIGLMPEEEAYAKQVLAESYQVGVNNVVRASGGNRNVVLANLGRLDAQQGKGMVQIALADAQAKREAMYKYGEAMKYVNEFDANKDIANNERDYKEALLDKEAGAELAAAGFTKMLDEMAYYRENKPGSAMSIAKSIYFQDNLGYDPNKKDDGTGKPGTKSAFDNQVAQWESVTKNQKENRDIWNNMEPKKKAIVDKFNTEVGFGTKSDAFLRYMSGQEVVPTGDLNYKKLNEVKGNDFSPIFETSKEFSSYTDPLNVSKPFESSFEKEKRNGIEKQYKEFNPLDNPFHPKEEEDNILEEGFNFGSEIFN